ncbi:MAG: hypothetical protein ACRD36_04855, partial [Candidatus Acidiferrum sp.]
MPVFDATTVSAFDATGPSGTPPAAGHAHLGPSDTLSAIIGRNPALTSSAITNSVLFNYGDVNDPQNRVGNV